MPLTPNRDQGGDEVYEGGQDLHGVENRADDCFQAIAGGSEYADRYAESDGDNH